MSDHGEMATSGLMTDSYAFTMAQALFEKSDHERAVFTFSFRQAPFAGNVIVAAGIEPLLNAIEELSFGADDLAFLRSMGRFSLEFLDYLRNFKFRGSVCCVDEGELVFPGEPVLRVEGSMMEGELVAGLVFCHLNYQSAAPKLASRWLAHAQAGVFNLAFPPGATRGRQGLWHTGRRWYSAYPRSDAGRLEWKDGYL